jgi:hypothetical protein
MRRKVLLEVKVSHDDVSGGLEEVLELFVEDKLATVIWVLETLLGNVLVDELGHLRTRDELTLSNSHELAQLRCNFLLAVEAVVRGASLSLLTIRVLLGVLHLTDDLGESLNISTD